MTGQLRSRRAGVLVLACALVGCRGEPASKGAALDSQDQVAPEPQTAAAAFEVALSSHMTLNGQSLSARLNGALAASNSWELGDESWRTLRFVDPRVALSGQGREGDELEGIERPFALRFDEQGAIQELALEDSVPVETRRMVQALVGLLQFVCPSTGGEPSAWETTERDGTGSYRARYQRGDAGWVTKNKVAYEDLSVPIDVTRSQLSYRPSPEGAVRCGDLPGEIAGTETLASGTLGFTATTTLTLKRRAGGAELPQRVVGGLPSEYRRSGISEVTSLARNELEIPGQDTVRLSSALAQLDPSVSRSFPWKTLRALAARLSKHPEEISELESRFRGQDEYRHALGALLVNIAHPKARRLLDELLEDESLLATARIGLLTALLFGPALERSTLDRVHQLARSTHEEVSAAAVNTEGALIRRAQEQAAFDVEPLINRYIEARKNARSLKVRISYLHGLSYIGGERTLTALHQAVEDDEAAIRSAALRALENVQEPRADAWIIDRMFQDPTPRVREQALRSCGYRASKACGQALERAVSSEKDVHLRRRAVEIYAQAGAPDATRAVLGRAARQDASLLVREAAQAALERLAAGEDKARVAAAAGSTERKKK